MINKTKKCQTQNRCSEVHYVFSQIITKPSRFHDIIRTRLWDLKLIFTSADIYDDLRRLHIWNLAKECQRPHQKLKQFVVDSELGNQENDRAHKDFDSVVSSHLIWTEHVNYKISQAPRAYHKSKNTIPWSTPSRRKFMPYDGLVLSSLIYSCQLWDLNISCLQKLENFHCFCLTCVFGETEYTEILKTNSVSPLSLLLQLNMMTAFKKLFQRFYNFDILPYETQSSKPENRRWTCFNPFSIKPNSASLLFFIMLLYLSFCIKKGRDRWAIPRECDRSTKDFSIKTFG